jgi:hypothetical protein
MQIFQKNYDFVRKYLLIFVPEYGKLQICRGKNPGVVSGS